MTKDQIKEHLAQYRISRARLEHLRMEADELLKEINRAARSALADEAIRGQQYTGMPPAGSVRQTVQDTVIRYADGYVPPLIRDEMARHAELETQIRQLERDVRMVENWLGCLNDREKTVILQHHPVGELCWRELAAKSSKLLGESMSQSGLRKVAESAMKKIYAVAV